MICKKCGADNPNPHYHAVHLPVALAPFGRSVLTDMSIPVRWACYECGRFHFRDGTLYDYETARKLGSERGSALPK